MQYVGWTDDAERKGGQQRFEDIVLALPDEEYEYGSRELGRDKEGVGLRGRRSEL